MDNNTVDVFGRQRTSMPFGIFNSSLQNSMNTAEWETVTSGTGSATYLPFESAASLSIGTANGDRCLRQTLRTFQYQTGTGMQVMMTGVIGAGRENTRSRIGIFDDLNGLFFEVRDGVFGICLRKTLTENNTQEIFVPQSEFSRDKVDGTGPSEYILDSTKAQIFVIDYAWLGVGRARFSIWTGDCFCPVHEFNFANILDTVYMGKGDLPLRYEIVNTGVSSDSASLKQICGAVFVEGGLNDAGYSRAVTSLENSFYNVPNTNDWYNLLAVRVAPNQPRVEIKVKNFSILNDSNSFFQVGVFKNATLPTLTWESVSSYSEFARLGGIITGGILIAANTGASRAETNLNLSEVRDSISLRYDNTSETFSLAIRRISGNSTVSATLNYLEFR